MVCAILYFRVLLIGRKFTVYTDHKALIQWLSRAPVGDRHARWVVKLQDMDFDIQYVKGEENVIADLLSRPAGVRKCTPEELHEYMNVSAIFLDYMDDEV